MNADGRRLAVLVDEMAAAVFVVARDKNLTNDELLAALAFLTEVGRADEFVLLSDVMGLSRQVDDQTHASEDGTASNVMGPFYRAGAPEISNPGSIIDPSHAGADEPLVFAGRVLDALTGEPIPGAEVDVWQADGEGAYAHADGPSPWHLRGRQQTDAQAAFHIQTVVPLYYTVKDDGPTGRLLAALGRHPWRPAHIHARVTAAGYRPLVTQVYVAGGRYLEDDTINGVKEELIAPVLDGAISFNLALSPVRR